MDLKDKQLLLDFYAKCAILSDSIKQDMMINLI